MLEISLDGNPGIEVELESSSQRLRELYYIGGRKGLRNIVFSPTGHLFVADTDRILIRCVYCDTRNNLTFHSTSHRSPWITSNSEGMSLNDYSAVAVTAEAAGSSPVVPAI